MIDDLLQEYRADVPEPDDATVARAFARATAARRRPVPWRAGAVVVGVAAAAAALLLAAPWRTGPGALTPADAAQIADRVSAAIAPKPGWIFHERLTVTGGSGRSVYEVWRLNRPPYTRRYANGRYDIGDALVYDPTTRAVYPYRSARRVAVPSADEAQRLRVALATPSGRAHIAGTTHVDGHRVYRIRDGAGQWTYYVDTTTYVPVRLVQRGLPMRPGTTPPPTVVRYLAYEYLPPTAANLRLLDVGAQHPHARRASALQLSPELRRLLDRSRPPAAAPRAPFTRPLAVDLAGGKVGALRLGDSLLRFVTAWGPAKTIGSVPGSITDAAATMWSSGRSLPWAIVSFVDVAEEHANGILYRGPLRTARGDRLGAPRAAVLAHWPAADAPRPFRPVAGWTEVPLGRGAFLFDAAGKLAGIRVGDGGAADYATLPG